MSVWAVLQHVPFEGPGMIAVQAHAHGIELDERHLYRGDALPSLKELAGLVVLGGPMGVGDIEQYPHLAGEVGSAILGRFFEAAQLQRPTPGA